MEISVRHLRPDDIEAVHEILLGQHVIVGTMRLPLQPLEHTRKRLEPEDGVVKLVAEAGGNIVGFAELITFQTVPRHRHVGEVNMIATDEKWLGKGVGRTLMAALIDLADNWLQLTRLGLIVWTNNQSAIELYKTFGFAVEGTMANYVFGEGGYMDACMMGRLKPIE